jgi:hypothetical protein
MSTEQATEAEGEKEVSGRALWYSRYIDSTRNSSSIQTLKYFFLTAKDFETIKNLAEEIAGREAECKKELAVSIEREAILTNRLKPLEVEFDQLQQEYARYKVYVEDKMISRVEVAEIQKNTVPLAEHQCVQEKIDELAKERATKYVQQFVDERVETISLSKSLVEDSLAASTQEKAKLATALSESEALVTSLKLLVETQQNDLEKHRHTNSLLEIQLSEYRQAMTTLTTDLTGNGDPIKKELREELSNLKLYIRNEALIKESNRNSIASLEKTLVTSEESLKSMSERHEKALKLLAKRTSQRDKLRNVFADIQEDLNLLFAAVIHQNKSVSTAKDWDESVEEIDKIKRKAWKHKVTGRTSTLDPFKATALLNKLHSVIADSEDSPVKFNSPAKSALNMAHKMSPYDFSSQETALGADIKTTDILRAILKEEGCDVRFLSNAKKSLVSENQKKSGGKLLGRKSISGSMKRSPLEMPTVSSTLKTVYNK